MSEIQSGVEVVKPSTDTGLGIDKKVTETAEETRARIDAMVKEYGEAFGDVGIGYKKEPYIPTADF